jgi:hypothetical protein
MAREAFWLASPLFPYDAGVNGKILLGDLAESAPEKYTSYTSGKQ